MSADLIKKAEEYARLRELAVCKRCRGTREVLGSTTYRAKSGYREYTTYGAPMIPCPDCTPGDTP